MRRSVLFGLVVMLAVGFGTDGMAQPADTRAPGPQANFPVPGGGAGGQRPPGRPKPPAPPPQHARPGRPQPPAPRPLPPAYRRHLPRHRYRLGAYPRPGGYYFRQWDVGMVLPGFFRAQGYWLTAPGRYGLRPSPGGAQWVRVDNDAVLVSNTTGRVIDIVYGVFY